jgi:nitrate reductase gamma subunit
MSEFLHFSEHTLHVFALGLMALVYTMRIIWFLSFKAGGERQGPTGDPHTTPAKGILYSWANIAMPWAMESTRKRFPLYLQFAVFHLGVAAAILLAFAIPYAPGLLESNLVIRPMQGIIFAASLVGVIRLVRRIGSPYMRAISSPDDYFSLALLTIWLFVAFLTVPHGHLREPAAAPPADVIRLTFVLLTTFFLIYVPFSKISHYLYYPFTRYYFGKTMGYRGVYPIHHYPKVG